MYLCACVYVCNKCVHVCLYNCVCLCKHVCVYVLCLYVEEPDMRCCSETAEVDAPECCAGRSGVN